MPEEGFVKYRAKNIPKVNAIRRAQSRPELCGVPILQPGQVMFSPSESAHDEPRSCYNCVFFNAGRNCQLIGPHIEIHKYLQEAAMGSKAIEFWPVCGYWVYGIPNHGLDKFIGTINPDDAGLGWVNAPRVGLELSGSSCGGADNGDDCDFWMTNVDDKRSAQTGFCRVLQQETANLDCCSCWIDDDWLDWRMVQERFKESK